MEVCGKQIHVQGRIVRIAFLDGEGYQFLDDPVAAADILRENKERIDLFTFIPRLSESSPKFSYPVETDNMAVLRVSTLEDWMGRQINGKSRNKVRKASKSGVITREIPLNDELIRGISVIYNETPVRQGRQFPHYRIDLETLRKMKSTFHERSIFIGAFHEEKLIGFAKLVYDENCSQAGLMHILSMVGERDKAPTNALIGQAVRSCADRRITYLWYAKFAYEGKRPDSLAEFKRHNGFEKVEFPRFYVPLTIAGGLAVRLGLHRSTAAWIPEPISATFRKIRSSWYARRQHGIESA